MTDKKSRAPLVAHVIHHFGVGGLENGVVNLINHMPEHRYRHAIVCLQGYSDFHQRIRRRDVEMVALDKQPGKDLGLYLRLWRTLRRLKPDIVHTRNLSALEGQAVAALAGVSARVHGEHGRDVFDLHGANRKYNLLRRGLRPLVGHYIAVSRDLENWLRQAVGARAERVAQIYNGVDSVRFHPRAGERPAIGPAGFADGAEVVIGSIGRMAAVKDFPTLVRAFLRLLESEPEARARLRLAIIGEGEAREQCLELLRQAGAADLAWLPGERSDTAELLRGMDVFVLPSLGEGTSNTILEAMASGLPVVATHVGGNPELVREGTTGALVPPADADSLASALRGYIADPERRRLHGRAARAEVERRFSMEAMVNGYLEVYDRVLRKA